ncbi:hypothetical protein DPM19_04325 [Actinomadura craniellae]|uniref:SAM-dependent methyltransferase n=1 Tax=Actinomadura craniellae TaxID=2231787 RepID=A0A365HB49_9ACTN|nr:SAM-dependent methyltransferase [Actinomadura craniellae]RAY16156.1 hypothetical protein DPM19_04325 [Actinomadura craniellae]
MEQNWIPEGIDTGRASAARVYDYYLGGTHHFPADRELAEQVISLLPKTPAIMRANRAFLRRAVTFCAATGIDQFLDLGSGIPTSGPVHEVARDIRPDARVVYVDSDEVAVAHARELLRDDPQTTVLHADLREVERVMGAPELHGLLDLERPVAVLLLSVLQFVPDEDDPAGVVAAYRDRIAVGSHLVLSHATAEGLTEQASAITDLYARSENPIRYRPTEQVRRMFEGFGLVEPGLVHLPQWRPDGSAEALRHLEQVHGAAGVGIKA